MANIWTYKSSIAEYDPKNQTWWDWDARSQRIYGLDKICDYYGSNGWELVSVVPLISGGGNQFNIGISTQQLLLFFKKPQYQ